MRSAFVISMIVHGVSAGEEHMGCMSAQCVHGNDEISFLQAKWSTNQRQRDDEEDVDDLVREYKQVREYEQDAELRQKETAAFAAESTDDEANIAATGEATTAVERASLQGWTAEEIMTRLCNKMLEEGFGRLPLKDPELTKNGQATGLELTAETNGANWGKLGFKCPSFTDDGWSVKFTVTDYQKRTTFKKGAAERLPWFESDKPLHHEDIQDEVEIPGGEFTIKFIMHWKGSNEVEVSRGGTTYFGSF